MMNRQIARTIYAVFKTNAAHVKIAFEYMCPLAFPLRRAAEHVNLFIIFIMRLWLPRTRKSFWVHSAAVYTRFKHYITCHLRAKQDRPPKISGDTLGQGGYNLHFAILYYSTVIFVFHCFFLSCFWHRLAIPTP